MTAMSTYRRRPTRTARVGTSGTLWKQCRMIGAGKHHDGYVGANLMSCCDFRRGLASVPFALTA